MKEKSAWLIIILFCLTSHSRAQQGQISIPRIELFPVIPQPLHIRNWKKTAKDYDSLVFNTSIQGQFLPLISFAPAGQFNYPENEAILLDTYVGSNYHHQQAEAINIIPTIVGATLVGVDKSNQQGTNYVAKLKDFFNLKNGQKLYLNNYLGVTGEDWWYEVMPNVFFLQVKKLYPQCYPEASEHMHIIADQWAKCIKVLGGSETPWNAPQMNYRAFNFKTLKPLTSGVPEPEAAGAIGWILINVFEQTGNKAYRIAAEQAMEFLNQLTSNPSYELQLAYGTAAAARMNATLGTNYNLEKLLGWCFEKGPLRGWGAIKGNWGGYSVSGLLGEVSDNENEGYAFSMNGFQQAGALAPIPKYDKRFARSIAKWLLNLSNASGLFYSDVLPADQQDSYLWASQYDPLACIPYEALKAPWKGHPIYAKGDALAGGWAQTNLSLYSGSSVGYLAALINSTNHEGILEINMNATDWFSLEDLPAMLFYNPYSEPKTIQLELPSGYDKIYEAITESHFSTSSGNIFYLTLPPDEARIVRLYSSADSLYTLDNKLMANNRILDYNYNYSFRKPLRIKSIGLKTRVILKGSHFDAWCNAENTGDNPSYLWILDNDTLASNNGKVSLVAPSDTGIYSLTCIVNSGIETTQDTVSLRIVSALPEITKIDSISSDKSWYQKSSLATFKVWVNGDNLDIIWKSPILSFIDSVGNGCTTWLPSKDTAFWLKTIVTNTYGISSSDSIAVLVKDTTQLSPEPLIWLPFDNSMNNVINNSLIPQSFETKPEEDPRGIPQFAIHLFSSNSYLRFNSTSDLNFGWPLSLSIWLNPESYGIERYLISHGSWQERFKLSLLPDRRLRFTANTSSGIIDLDTKKIISPNQYTHATAVYSGYSLEIYLNGNLETFVPFQGNLNTSEKPLLLGRMLENTTEYAFIGKIDEFRLYHGLLQPNHIKMLPKTWYTTPNISDSLKIYPNPCSKNSILHLWAPSPIKEAEMITFTGIRLPLIFKFISPNDIEFSAPGRSGVYLVKIIYENGNNATSKIIVIP